MLPKKDVPSKTARDTRRASCNQRKTSTKAEVNNCAKRQTLTVCRTENEIFKRDKSSKKDDREREAQGPHHIQRCSEKNG